MEAVKALRAATKLNQVAFAASIGRSYPTVQRYENIRPPKGAALKPLIALAESQQRSDLQRIFQRYLIESAGDVSAEIESAMQNLERRRVSDVIPELSYLSNGTEEQVRDAMRAIGAWAACMTDYPGEIKPILAEILKVLHTHQNHRYDAIATYEGVPEIEAAK